MKTLTPFDIVLALKIGLNEKRLREFHEKFIKDNELSEINEIMTGSNSVGDLSESLRKGKGEISRSIHRLLYIGLIGERSKKEIDPPAQNRKHYSIQRSALSDLLCSGIRYVFSPEKSGMGRGMVTGWSNSDISSPMNPPEIPLVWSMPGGKTQGEILDPLYPGAPQASLEDKDLHLILCLIDVLRTGKPRELSHAKEILKNEIKGLHS